MTKHLFATAAALATALFAAPAFAAELNFRSGAFAGAEGDSSFQYTASDGVTLTFTAGPVGTRLSHSGSDGFGVRSHLLDDPEIEGVETLTISFSETVLISDVFLTDLFIDDPFFGRPYAEVGYYTANSGTTQFQAVATGGINGELTLSPDIWADAIVFTAPGFVSFTQSHEYSVAGLNYSTQARDVPELDPSAAGTALLLIIGAALMLAERRRTAAL